MSINKLLQAAFTSGRLRYFEGGGIAQLYASPSDGLGGASVLIATVQAPLPAVAPVPQPAAEKPAKPSLRLV